MTGKYQGRRRNLSSYLNSKVQQVVMELILVLERQLGLDVEEIVRETGLEAAVVDHLGCEVVAAVVIIRKMLKMAKENTLVDLVEEDLAAVHVCPTDQEEKDLAAEAAVPEVAAEGSVEDNADQLQLQKHGMKVPSIPPLRTWNHGESTRSPLLKIGTMKNTLVLWWKPKCLHHLSRQQPMVQLPLFQNPYR